MPTALVTGANRGLGLEFVKQYASDGWRVYAVVRDPGHGIKELEKLAAERRADITIETLDVTDFAAVDALAEKLTGTPIDLLINNAGSLTGDRGSSGRVQSLDALDFDRWSAEFRLNAQAPLAMARAFADHVAASDHRTIVNMTSGLGMISNTDAGGFYYYRSAKAALNMVTKALAADLADRGITVLALDPGWVRTRMGGESANIAPSESVTGLREVIAGAGPDMSGRIFNRHGEERQP